jgi:oligopeptide transport system substrate-binding protein
MWTKVVLFLLVGWIASLAPAEAKTFNMRLLSEPETLDWNRAHTPIETHVLSNLMEGLLSLDSKLQIKSALAEKWQVSPDGKIYTFYLRPGVKWSDGVPLRAQDFVYSWKRLLTSSTAAAYAYFLFDIVGAEAFQKGQIQDFNEVGVHAVSDSVLQVKLIHPVAHWIYIPTFWVTFPVRQDVVEKYRTNWTLPNHMVTLGPYLLARHDLESKIVLKINPLYYGKRGNIDEVVGLIVKDDSTALKLYQAGKLDFLTDISFLDLSQLKGRPDLKAFPYLKTGYLGFVVEKPLASNIHFRQAVALALDKSKLGALLQGGQQEATSFVPPPLLGASKKIGIPYDPVRAQEELKKSGLNLASSLHLDLVLPNTEKALMIGQFIQSELKKTLQIDLTLQPFDFKTYLAKVNVRSYPSFLLSWSADYPDPDSFLSMFLSGSGNNRTAWKSVEFDRQCIWARHLRNAKEREAIYLKMQKLLIQDETVIVPLYYEPNLALVRPGVKGLELNPLNHLNLREVSIER